MVEWNGMAVSSSLCGRRGARTHVTPAATQCAYVCAAHRARGRRARAAPVVGIRYRRSRPTALDACASLFFYSRVSDLR